MSGWWDLKAAQVAWADEAGPLLRREVAGRAPQGKTGALRESIYYRRQTKAESVVVNIASNKLYAIFVTTGTRAHPIDPVAASVLHFTGSGGGDVFATHVDHPGTKANPFAEEGWKARKDEVVQLFGRIAAREIGNGARARVSGLFGRTA
jgi:hypothetical protein